MKRRKRRPKKRRTNRYHPQQARGGDGLQLIYGSLYLDAQESYEYAEMQIDECIQTAGKQGYPPDRISLVFDLVGTPEQIKARAGHNVAKHLLHYMDTEYPTLRTWVIGITADDDNRPMRKVLEVNFDEDKFPPWLVCQGLVASCRV